MAEVLSKTNLVSSWHQNHHHHHHHEKKLATFCSLKLNSTSDFHGKRISLQKSATFPRRGTTFQSQSLTIKAQTLRIGKAQKWWEKGVQPNMKEVESAEDLVESLSKAGDKLVIVDFFSPGCGGCRALHPKICQMAEMNPDVQFLQINYEEHKSMCYSLNVHVLPFFRFYRGAHGRLCSFSCTNATIKKFKDALAKHTTDRCSIGPVKGLEEKELLALAANKDLSFNYTPKEEEEKKEPIHTEKHLVVVTEEANSSSSSKEHVLPRTSILAQDSIAEEKTTLAGATAGR
jgi:thiol-disulfide isomerase/thioredoxin